jgi:outer membrane receptor protein involved in Fe transport
MNAYLARGIGAASVLALAIGCAGAARAQQNTALEEIVVTAQKREEPLLVAPLAITALTNTRLEQLGVRDLADVSLHTPGLIIFDQSVNNPSISIRGITSDNNNAFFEPRISIFQDGVSISKTQASYVELFDMQRVEVVKGPQSTLYGRSALIGGVNLIQNKAQIGETSGFAHGEAGDYGYFMGEGALNVPLADDLALRLSGRWRKRDGYVKNALGGADFQGVRTGAFRAAVKYAPDDRLNVDLIGNYQEDHPSGTAFKSRNYYPTNPVTGQVLAGLEPWEPAAINAPANFENGRGLGQDRTVGGVTALVDYKLSQALTLHSITAWRAYKSADAFDADGTSLPILTGVGYFRGDQWSQELRLNYDDGGRVRGFFGGSFFRNSDEERVPLQFDERTALAQLTGQLGFGMPAHTPLPLGAFSNTAFTGALLRGLVAATSGNQIILSPAQAMAIAGNLLPAHVEQAFVSSQITSWDFFGDTTVKVTDKLELTAGLRYSHERTTTGYGASVRERSVLGGAIGAAQLASSGSPAAIAQAQAILAALTLPNPPAAVPLFALVDQPTAGNGQVSTGRIHDGGVAFRLLGRYAVSDTESLYASYARGRRPPVLGAGGPAVPGGQPTFGAEAAEEVDSYEVGGKGRFLDGRLSADIAAYLYNYRHFQTLEQHGVRFFVTDAGRARSYGVETQVAWKAAPGLELYANYAYSHARLKSGLYAGNHFRLSPDHSAALSAVWTTPVYGGSLQVMPSFTWRSEMFFSDNNDKPALQQPPNALVPDNIQDELQKGYGIANLRVTWTPEGGRATIEAFATNLFDKKYIIDAGNTGDTFGLPTFIAGKPRMWGAGVYYRF